MSAFHSVCSMPRLHKACGFVVSRCGLCPNSLNYLKTSVFWEETFIKHLIELSQISSSWKSSSLLCTAVFNCWSCYCYKLSIAKAQTAVENYAYQILKFVRELVIWLLWSCQKILHDIHHNIRKNRCFLNADSTSMLF